jgi:predicted unusual protein kinase regulating ubiquinone biosynthesis (AarF/ABC1/UbiB family)
MVDLRFNRARYDTQRIVQEFAQRLRDEVDLEALSGELRETGRTTMGPRTISLWLRAGEAAR